MGFLEGSQMVSNAINTRAKVKEMRAADKFNDSMTAAKDAHAQGIKDLEASGVSGSELEARRSALDTARWEAERDAYVQRYGDADKYINHQKSIQEANKTSRDNMALEAQRKAFAHQQNQIQANQFLRNIGELNDDDKTKSLQFINNYYSDMMDGGTIGYANGAFSVTDKAGNVRSLSAQEAQGFATRLMEDRSNLENLFTLTGIAQGSMDEYHKDQEELSDRATEAVTRGKTKAETAKNYAQAKYYNQAGDIKGAEAHAARQTPNGTSLIQDDNGDIVGEKDPLGNEKALNVNMETHNANMEAISNEIAKAVKAGAVKENAVVGTGYDRETGTYGTKVKTSKGVIHVPMGQLGTVFKPKEGIPASSKPTAKGHTFWGDAKRALGDAGSAVGKSVSKTLGDNAKAIATDYGYTTANAKLGTAKTKDKKKES